MEFLSGDLRIGEVATEVAVYLDVEWFHGMWRKNCGICQRATVRQCFYSPAANMEIKAYSSTFLLSFWADS